MSQCAPPASILVKDFNNTGLSSAELHEINRIRVNLKKSWKELCKLLREYQPPEYVAILTQLEASFCPQLNKEN
jgi:hypothetical protein